MNTIKVNTANLKRSSNTIKAEVDSLNNQIKSINTSLEYIEQNWLGTDASLYVNAIRNVYIQELTKLKDVTDMFGSYLEVVAKEYEKVDNEQKEIFEQIEV